METAKVFWSGRSQAVRLPKEFRFNTEAVHIRRHGNAVILEPITDNWEWLNSLTSQLDKDFITASKEKPKLQERATLKRLFR